MAFTSTTSHALPKFKNRINSRTPRRMPTTFGVHREGSFGRVQRKRIFDLNKSRIFIKSSGYLKKNIKNNQDQVWLPKRSLFVLLPVRFFWKNFFHTAPDHHITNHIYNIQRYFCLTIFQKKFNILGANYQERRILWTKNGASVPKKQDTWHISNLSAFEETTRGPHEIQIGLFEGSICILKFMGQY